LDNDQEENTTGFSLMPISDKEFNTITGMVYRQAGISLSPKKKTLVVGRLQMMLRTLGLNSFTEYIDFLANDPSGGALQDMIDRISTNHTFFFREEAHFEFFHKTALPEMEILANKKGEKDLRIWSAGCATGEEPYMLAMLLTEYFGQNLSGWDAGVLATDISTKALKTAVEGMYPDDKLAHIPIHLRRKYFYDEGNGMWRVVDQLKREVTFRQFNLMTPEFPLKGGFKSFFAAM